MTDQANRTHGMADVEPGVRIHYVIAGNGPRTAILLHGFPQTWWEWHHVIPRLVEAGYRVWHRITVAPVTRGARVAVTTSRRWPRTSTGSCATT